MIEYFKRKREEVSRDKTRFVRQLQRGNQSSDLGPHDLLLFPKAQHTQRERKLIQESKQRKITRFD